MSELRAEVLGPPQFVGNKRGFVNRKTGRVIIAERKSGAVKGWQQEMREQMAACAPETPLNEPVRVSIAVYFRRPLSHYGTGKNAARLKDSAPHYAGVKPDADKIARAVLDCLTGIWVVDDSRVVSLSVFKFYAGDGKPERTEVEAWPWGPAVRVEEVTG